MGDETRREVDVNIPHRYDLTGVLEATFYLHIGKRSIPRQIDLASDECLNQGIVVGIEHPIELDAMPTKMRLKSSEYADVSRRCCPTKPYHSDLLSQSPARASASLSRCSSTSLVPPHWPSR